MRLNQGVFISVLLLILFEGCTYVKPNVRTYLHLARTSPLRWYQQLYYSRAVTLGFAESDEALVFERFMLFSRDIRTDDVCRKLVHDGRWLYAKGYHTHRQFVIAYVRILMMNGVGEESQILIRHHNITIDEML